jgi:hypothetical protein
LFVELSAGVPVLVPASGPLPWFGGQEVAGFIDPCGQDLPPRGQLFPPGLGQYVLVADRGSGFSERGRTR